MSVLQRVHMPSLDGATGWVKSDPPGPAGLRGHVVLVNFWTLTCINWLRQEPTCAAIRSSMEACSDRNEPLRTAQMGALCGAVFCRLLISNAVDLPASVV